MRENTDTNVMHFDSVADVGHYVKKTGYICDDQSTDWFGNLTKESCCHTAINGDDSKVDSAKKMMEKFSNNIETLRAKTVPSVVGGFASVPAYLSGNPQSMRKRKRIPNEAAPITILVDTACSEGVSAKTMEKRGIAILSLVMMLSESRPVALYVCAAGDADRNKKGHAPNDSFHIVSARIETAPLDLATAGFALTHVGFFRRLFLGIGMQYFTSHGRWAQFEGRNGGSCAETKMFRSKMIGYLDMPDDTLFIPPASSISNDRENPNRMLLNEPERWVHVMLEKFGAVTARENL